MKANLLRVKERLEKEGIIDEVIYDEDFEELIVNEQCFFYNNVDCDWYYIAIMMDSDKKYYVAENRFRDEEFLDKYNNQEDYVRKVINEMNMELAY